MENNWSNVSSGGEFAANNGVVFYPLGPPAAIPAINSITWNFPTTGNKIPHKCPVCLGYGKVTWSIDDHGIMQNSIWYLHDCPAKCVYGILWG